MSAAKKGMKKSTYLIIWTLVIALLCSAVGGSAVSSRHSVQTRAKNFFIRVLLSILNGFCRPFQWECGGMILIRF